MKSFAPCLVVMLAGLAIGVTGAYAWITGPPQYHEHYVVGMPAVVTTSIRPDLWSKRLPPAVLISSISRGGKALKTQ